MRIEDNVVIVAAAIVVTVLFAALLPRDMFREGLANMPHQLAQTLAPLGAANQDWAAGRAQPLPVVQTVPRSSIKPGFVKLEQASKVYFSGVIQQISEMPQQDGQIHIWLESPTNQEVQISVAPSWFLEYIGCQLSHDLTISGLGFRFDAGGPNQLVYARRLQVGGKTYQLRNDEGFALWSNRLR